MIYLLSDCGRNLAAKYKKKGALSMERGNAWKVYDQTELEKLDKINETYIRIVWMMGRQSASVSRLQ